MPPNIDYVLFQKTGVNNSYDDANRRMQWSVTINPKRTALGSPNPNLTSVEFQDLYQKPASGENNYNWMSFGLTAQQQQEQIDTIEQTISEQLPPREP